MAIACALAAISAAVAPGASTPPAADIRGHWVCVDISGNCGFDITTLDLETGAFTGRGAGDRDSWPVTGTLSGRTLTATIGPYDSAPAFSLRVNGRITADGGVATGTVTNPGGRSSPIRFERTSGPPNPKPKQGVSVVAGESKGTVATSGRARRSSCP